MKKISSRDPDGYIVRSGTRMRDSVRSLPKGQFQQYRRMFEQSPSQQPARSSVGVSTATTTTTKLSTIHERGHVKDTLPPSLLLKLPVTDDEKLQHSSSGGSCNGAVGEHRSTRPSFFSIDQTNNYPIKPTTSLPAQATSSMMGSTPSRGKTEMNCPEQSID